MGHGIMVAAPRTHFSSATTQQDAQNSFVPRFTRGNTMNLVDGAGEKYCFGADGNGVSLSSQGKDLVELARFVRSLLHFSARTARARIDAQDGRRPIPPRSCLALSRKRSK